CQKYIASPLTF
nr:immunoglobulin light chain junction region [Macaca mulatta]MOV76927.1 immunoglobulin light chain junction region [Macaca mulatta]MOV76998.1 immunoglobulin light chain junction region [Macaca mulatta]MOW12536.1 immunoglobulin light chain junction region [Macaca mulatta]MOX48357.1 immunoglobulin light chain junction region [Macaca mulatta]